MIRRPPRSPPFPYTTLFRSRTLGFPTINLPLWSPRTVSGIYAVRVYGVDVAGGSAVVGAASVGVRPTVTQNGQPLLEVFLIDFQGDLYGRRVVVEFVKRIRPEEKFDSLEVLTAQMHRDIQAVREVFQKARAVALCANGVESPRLLLNSKTSRAPDGLANSSGLVGKYLMWDNGAFVSGLFEEPLNECKGIQVGRVLHDFYNADPKRGFDGGGGIDARVNFYPVSFGLGG